MNVSSKKDLAVAFLAELASMSRERLQQIIRTTVGEELAGVMFGYAQQVLNADPEKMTENASSLLILGYLIRVHEDGGLSDESLPA